MSFKTYIPTKGEEIVEAGYEFFKTDSSFEVLNSIKRATFFDTIETVNSYQFINDPYEKAFNEAEKYINYYFKEKIDLKRMKSEEVYPNVFLFKFSKNNKNYILALFTKDGMKYFQQTMLPFPQQTVDEKNLSYFSLS